MAKAQPNDSAASEEQRESCADPTCSEPRKENGYFCGSEHETDVSYQRRTCPQCDARCIRKGGKWVCPTHGTMSNQLMDLAV